MLWRLKQHDQRKDEELLQLFQKNSNEELVGILMNRHIHKVYGVCLNYLKNQSDAEDAVMEIFEQLPQKASTYDIKHFGAWLFNVSRNHCIKILKQKAKTRTALLDEISEDFFVESSPENTLSIEDRRIEVLSDAINQLKEGQKQCIILFFLEQKSYREIEMMTTYTAKEIKSHIQNGKRNLKNLILKLT